MPPMPPPMPKPLPPPMPPPLPPQRPPPLPPQPLLQEPPPTPPMPMRMPPSYIARNSFRTLGSARLGSFSPAKLLSQNVCQACLPASPERCIFLTISTGPLIPPPPPPPWWGPIGRVPLLYWLRNSCSIPESARAGSFSPEKFLSQKSHPPL